VNQYKAKQQNKSQKFIPIAKHQQKYIYHTINTKKQREFVTIFYNTLIFCITKNSLSPQKQKKTKSPYKYKRSNKS